LTPRPPKAGELFIVRLKVPAGYKIPAHWHPTDENVTVISGTFNMGMGDKLDPAKTKAFPAGSFAVAPAKVNHFALAKKEAIVEVSAMGPFAMTYVNPDDDPSKTAKK
jgi:quercetin dioxygenase-like cupin family protein